MYDRWLQATALGLQTPSSGTRFPSRIVAGSDVPGPVHSTEVLGLRDTTGSCYVCVYMVMTIIH